MSAPAAGMAGFLFWERCKQLETRGLCHEVAVQLWDAGDLQVLAELEAASDADLRAVNDEWRRRREEQP